MLESWDYVLNIDSSWIMYLHVSSRTQSQGIAGRNVYNLYSAVMTHEALRNIDIALLLPGRGPASSFVHTE
jgi:hypothetical protein